MKYFQDPGTYSFGAPSMPPGPGEANGGDSLLHKIGDNDFDRLVKHDVDFMYATLETHWDFDLEKFKNIGDPGEAAVYFMLHYERPRYQGQSEQNERSVAGKQSYEEFKNFKCSSSSTAGTNTNFTSTTDLSSNSTAKYDAEDDKIEDFAKFAVSIESDDEKYDTIISKSLDDFEKNNPDNKGKSDAFFTYVADANGNYIYKDKYAEYQKSDKSTIKIESEQLEKARSIIIDGQRTTTTGKITVTDGRKQGTDICEDDKKKGIGNARIAEAAAEMSWPVQVGQGDDAHAGMCFDGKSWIKFDWSAQTCFHNPRPLYKEYWDKWHSSYGVFDIYEDCGFFVATVLHYLDIASKDMWSQPWFDENADAAPDWTRVTNGGATEAELKPGDVLQDDAHIIIYAGSYGGDYGTYAHASRKDRVGAIGKAYDPGRWRVFRYSGDKLGTGDIDEENGLTLEQARQFMRNYGANKNESSRHVVGNYMWDICNGGGSNCVTFSQFYINKFTSGRYVSGDGITINQELVGGVHLGHEPKVWSVFASSGQHTGVILGKHDGEWIVGHASCKNKGKGEGDGNGLGDCWNNPDSTCGSGFVRHSSDIYSAQLGYNASSYAYFDTVDINAIYEYLENGE